MKTLSAKMKKEYKQISSMVDKLKKKFFEFEILHSEWEAEHADMKAIKSGKEYIATLIR